MTLKLVKRWKAKKKKKKKIETTNIDETNYKHLVICFTTYIHSKSIKLLNLHYHKFIGKIE